MKRWLRPATGSSGLRTENCTTERNSRNRQARQEHPAPLGRAVTGREKCAETCICLSETLQETDGGALCRDHALGGAADRSGLPLFQREGSCEGERPDG